MKIINRQLDTRVWSSGEKSVVVVRISKIIGRQMVFKSHETHEIPRETVQRRDGSLGFPGNMALFDKVVWEEGVWGGQALPRSRRGIQQGRQR